MNLRKKDKDQLIRYRLDQALETVKTVELLIQNKSFPAAINRIYYGIFYSLLALGLKNNFETSKHLQLIGWFNLTFVKTGKIDTEFGKILRRAYENRITGDYDVFKEFSEDLVVEMFDEMKKFIRKIEENI
jgi:uncharacterized protein (UPF0332 family)